MNFRQSYSEMISLDIKIKRNKDRPPKQMKEKTLTKLI